MADEHEIGYGKPPKHSQFKKGRSGNPVGRPKGTKNLKTDLAEELQEVVHLREGGQSKQVSKQRAMLKALMARALKGDPRAADLILKIIFRLLEVNVPEEEAELSLDEHAILDDYEAEIIRKAQRKSTGSRRRTNKKKPAKKKKIERRPNHEK